MFYATISELLKFWEPEISFQKEYNLNRWNVSILCRFKNNFSSSILLTIHDTIIFNSLIYKKYSHVSTITYSTIIFILAASLANTLLKTMTDKLKYLAFCKCYWRSVPAMSNMWRFMHIIQLIILSVFPPNIHQTI